MITANSGYIGGTGGWAVSTGLISATNAKIGSNGTTGYIGFGSTPPTTYGDNVGAFLGYDTTAKMSLYADANNYLKWTGAALLLKAANVTLDASGNLTVAGGAIGGWVIGADYFRDAAGTVGMSSAVTGGDDIRLWAGHVTPASAPFRVTEAGVLAASSGTVGGWTLGAAALTGGNATLAASGNLTLGTGNDVVRLSADDATYRLWTGHATAASAPFRVTKAGAVTMTSATLSGSGISITLGTPGAFDLTQALAFARGAGTNGTGSFAGLYSTDGGSNQFLTLENKAVSETASARTANATLTAIGYTGAAATSTVQLIARSGPSNTDLRGIVGSAAMLTVTGTSVTLGSDTTTYNDSNNNLLSGVDNEQALGIAGATTATNINLYLRGTAAKKAVIQAVNSGTNGGKLNIATKADGGSEAVAMYIEQDGSVVVGSPTGGAKGAGTLNASALYDDGTIVADWVFDLHYDGRSADPHAGRLYSLADTMAITAAERRLPWMPSASDFEANRGLGALVTGLWQGQEQQQVYLHDHEARLARLEAAAGRAAIVSDRRRTDATRLSFPLQTVAAIVLGAVGVAGANWASQSGLRSSIALLQSDMRDLITRQTLQAEVAAAAARLQDERAASMKATIEEMKRRLELVQLQYQQLRETMLEDKPRTAR